MKQGGERRGDREAEGSADDTILPYRMGRRRLARPVAKPVARVAAPRSGIAPWMYLVPVGLLLLGGLGFVLRPGHPPAEAPPTALPSTAALAPNAAPTPTAPSSAVVLAPAAPPSAAATQPSGAPAPYLPFAREQDILADRAASLSMFRLAENPAILVLDFPSMREQARMLNRVAVLVETRGQPRNRVLDDAALDQAIRATGAQPDSFYDGHDYRAGDLVRFFALADRDAIRLNPDEAALRDLIRAAGWTDAGAVGALITIPTLGVGIDPEARAAILRHEISHGEFFTDPGYAAFTQRFWKSELTDAERTAFRRFLANQEYDPADETLMMNEMQAYLVHTGDPRFFRPDLVGMTPDRSAALRRRFIAGMPGGWFRDLTLRDARPKGG